MLFKKSWFLLTSLFQMPMIFYQLNMEDRGLKDENVKQWINLHDLQNLYFAFQYVTKKLHVYIYLQYFW
jgi:hypothetical protein